VGMAHHRPILSRWCAMGPHLLMTRPSSVPRADTVGRGSALSRSPLQQNESVHGVRAAAGP
jgi:hypothetical protein